MRSCSSTRSTPSWAPEPRRAARWTPPTCSSLPCRAGRLRCIGSTTHKEHKQAFGKDRALARRFQVVEVGEPSIDECVDILKGLQKHYEEHHKLRYEGEAVEAAARLAAKHINDNHLPDKAIDVLDETGAAIRLADRKVVTVDDIEDTIARIARIPKKSVSDAEEQLGDLTVELKRCCMDRTRQWTLSPVPSSCRGPG